MPTHVLIAGAGVAGLEAALALRALAEDRVSVELVSPDPEFVYRPLSVAAPFRVGEAKRFPVRRLAEEAGADLTEAAVRAVHPAREGSRDLCRGRALVRPPPACARRSAGAGHSRSCDVPRPGRRGSPRRGPARRGRRTRPATGVHHAGRHLLAAAPLRAGPVDGRPPRRLGRRRRPPARNSGAPAAAAVRRCGQRSRRRAPRSARNRTPDQHHPGRRGRERAPLRGHRRGRGGPGRCAAAYRGPAATRRSSRREWLRPDRRPRTACATSRTSTPPATSRTFRSSRVGWPPSRRTPQPKRSQPRPEPRSPRPRSRRFSAACCSPGLAPRFMRAEVGSQESQVDTEPLWWPPAKIVGRHLAPFLAAQLERLAGASTLGRPRGRSRARPRSGRRVGVDLSSAP